MRTLSLKFVSTGREIRKSCDLKIDLYNTLTCFRISITSLIENSLEPWKRFFIDGFFPDIWPSLPMGEQLYRSPQLPLFFYVPVFPQHPYDLHFCILLGSCTRQKRAPHRSQHHCEVSIYCTCVHINWYSSIQWDFHVSEDYVPVSPKSLKQLLRLHTVSVIV